MTILILSLSLVFGCIVAFYNSFVYKLYFTRDKIDNNIVHRLGAALRVIWMLSIIALCWFAKVPWEKAAFYTLFNINLAWTGFDLIYNWVHNHDWYYSGTLGSGTSSIIDKLFNKFDEYIKLGILIFTILWHPFHINEMIEDTILNRGWELLITVIIMGGFGYIAFRFYNRKDKA